MLQIFHLRTKYGDGLSVPCGILESNLKLWTRQILPAVPTNLTSLAAFYADFAGGLVNPNIATHEGYGLETP
jgi:hypothetical protein